MPDKLVIIPTYNEKENIEKIIRTVFSLPEEFHILVIDDGSPDGTAEIVKKLQQEFPNKLLLTERSGKLGLGTAYIAGFKEAIEKKYDYIFEMDADFSHPPASLSDLYTACSKDGADVAIGSRYIKGISVVNWPLGRILISYCASMYVRTILGMPTRDTTAGFVCYRREVLENIGIDQIQMKGYGFQIEMKYRSWKLGYLLKEIPIIFTDRTEGTSKMSGGIFSEALFGVLKMRLKSRKRTNQKNKKNK
ncbi:MAG: dolichyl-phosphate beta-D-mannosyltransferase [Bacteroidia bacterium]|nr:MAG: dolichyl-phosphate beta-D-mannosyltransferase [Bacteroidia bacterium]